MKTAALLACASVLVAGCLSDRDLAGRDDDVGHPEALLRGNPFAELVVDVDYMAGAEPTPESIDIAIAALTEVVDKSLITVEPATQIAGGAEVRRSADVEGVARAAQDVPGPPEGAGGVAQLHIIYARGTFGNETDDSIASGLYEPDTATVFVFTDTWRDPANVAFALLSSGIPPAWFEAEVLTHELGHAMGLINFGTPALTERAAAADDPYHSARASSVMYPGVHDAQDHLASMLARQQVSPIGFDAEDRADLDAFREGRTGPPLRKSA
jgi:hypothetical protein